MSDAKFALEITEDQVRGLFKSIEEYSHLEIVDIDILRKGMIHLASQPVGGGYSAWQVFVENLIKAAVEMKSKGVEPK